jgi:hypothetical protein
LPKSVLTTYKEPVRKAPLAQQPMRRFPKDPKITLSLISNGFEEMKILDELPSMNEHKPSDFGMPSSRQLSGRYRTVVKKRPKNPSISNL